MQIYRLHLVTNVSDMSKMKPLAENKNVKCDSNTLTLTLTVTLTLKLVFGIVEIVVGKTREILFSSRFPFSHNVSKNLQSCFVKELTISRLSSFISQIYVYNVLLWEVSKSRTEFIRKVDTYIETLA